MTVWRILVIEPDPHGAALLARVLASTGATVECFSSATQAKARIEQGQIDLVFVDEMTHDGITLDGVRLVRTMFPSVPVIVTGAMMSATVMLELLRLGVRDVLPKPFSPDELRAAVHRVRAQTAPEHHEALDHAAALWTVRYCLGTGQLQRAHTTLTRAWRYVPLEAESLALEALRAELSGEDDRASRGYRAAIALGSDEGIAGLHPWEGLARLRAYRRTRPVDVLDPRFQNVPIWWVRDPRVELSGSPPEEIAHGCVVMMVLSLGVDHPGCVYLRSDGTEAFALVVAPWSFEQIGLLLDRVGHGAIVTANTLTEPSDDLVALRAAHNAVRQGVPRTSQTISPQTEQNVER